MTRRLLTLLVVIAALFASRSLAQEEDAQLEAFQQNLPKRLARHPYFSKIAYDFLWDHEPFVFVVQKPARATVGYAEKVVKERLPILEALHVRFVEEFGRPLGLRLRPTSPRLAVFVFATPGDFENYQRVVWKTTYPNTSSFYLPSERLYLVREDPFGAGPKRSSWEDHLDLRKAARLVLHGYGSSSEALPGPLWFNAGLADDLASLTRVEREPSPPGLYWIGMILHDAELRRIAPLPLQQLFSLSTIEEAAEACVERSKGIRDGDVSDNWAMDLTVVHCGLLCHYLRQQADPAWRESMARFTEEAMKGKLRGRSFIAEKSAEELAELERAFYQFLWKEHARLWPDEPHDTAALTGFFAERWSPTAAVTLTGLGAESAIASITDPSKRVSLAIAYARTGDDRRAVKILETLAETDARAARELARVRAWVLLRDEYLASLVGSKSRLSITWLGEPLSAKVEKLEDGVLYLGKNKRDVASVPIGELDPAELAGRMGSRSAGFADRWARAYALVIAYEDKKAKRLLGRDGAELAALRSDFEEDYPGRRESIEALEVLVELERLGPPESVESAERTVELVQTIWSKRYNLELVLPLKGDLRLCAQRAYACLFEKRGLAAALGGELTEMSDGRVRLRYDFEDPKQLQDWPVEQWTGELSGGVELKNERSLLDSEKGKLRLAGSASCRHVLGFEGDQVIRWTDITHQGPGGARDDYHLSCRVMMCCDDDGSYVSSINSNTMEISDTGTGHFQNELTPVIQTHFDTEYRMELHHDGKEQVALWRDSQLDLELPCGARTSGGVRLLVHSDYVSNFDDLEIIGTITEESLGLFAVSWVEARLAEMKL